MAADLNKLSISELKRIKKDNQQRLKKDYEELKKKRKLIEEIIKIRRTREKINKNQKPKPQRKPRKIKTFEDYFQECIKNKTIPRDTPPYLRKALERAIREYEQGIEKEKSSLDYFANKYVIKGEPGISPSDYFKSKFSYLKEFLRNHRHIKVRFILVCLMEKMEKEKDILFEVRTKAFFQSDTFINFETTDVKKILAKVYHKILEKISLFQHEGSGWFFKEVICLEIHTVDYKPMRGGSSYIPLPDWIMRKKAIVSIRNTDNKCFLWSVLRYLHPREKNDCRLGDLKKYENELNTKGINFPVRIKDISKFESLNPDLPGINVFSVDANKKFYPLKMANKDPRKTIDLFYYQPSAGDLGGCNPPAHYSLIKNFSRLFRSQITTRTNEPIQICKRCFSHFTKKELLSKHIKYCSSNETVAVKMPPRQTFLKFENYSKQFPIPFVIYADFECFTKPMSNCSPNHEHSFSYNYQKHEPSGFCFHIKGINPDIKFKPIIYTKKNPDDDLALIFVNKLQKVANKIYEDFYMRKKSIKITLKQYKEYNKSVVCHICKKELLSKDKVCDHCHFTGEYRGPAHRICNLKCRRPMIIPVIFHNLQGYDAHLFIKQLSKIKVDFTCIPSTEEKYISFSKKVKVDEYQNKDGKTVSLNFELRFIDSFKFLQRSLADLVKNLQPDDFVNTKAIFEDYDLPLLTRKGVYPYDYVSSIEKFDETQLPPQEEFYSKLNDENITDDEYQHALNVWKTFGCKNIRDYHDLYLKSDTLLLADVFENFRSTCLRHYNLDPAHYYTSPGLAWDACLKETGQELQLLHDYDMLMMFERGIRGGISHISMRYAEANNKYMDNYDPDKPSTYIQYLGANNLYGWAMTQSLPTKGFKWMKNLTVDAVIKILEKEQARKQRDQQQGGFGGMQSPHPGYVFEVDLEYPSELWKKHNDYPLAPERLNIDGVKKLICHFKPRKNYVVHFVNLCQYLEMGMILTAVHRGISFKQSAWMEPYIRKNTKLRQCAANSFEKDFFKLMINSVFGKTIENIRKRQTIILVGDRDKALKLSSRPNFDRATIFNPNLVAIHMKKTEVYFNKPVYLGQAILDLSKTLMFDFHYNYIQEKFPKANLLFTDTDSLMYHIRTDDFYKNIAHDIKDKFDTSDYPSDHKSGIPIGINKKVIGMFKDEVAGKQITYFVGLRPKLYSFKIEECRGASGGVLGGSIPPP